MHIPFGKSVLHVLQQHIQDGITLVMKLLGTKVRTRIKVTVYFLPILVVPAVPLDCLGVPSSVLCFQAGSLTIM